MADSIYPNEGYMARFFQRDSDTLGTWGNTGLMMFAIFHEWGDSFDPATGATGTITGERYDSATGSFEPDCTVGTPVFNGRLSGLWDCVSRAWPDDLAAMYRAMRAAGFNADRMWELYQGFRGQWCEALYAADAMGYANTGRFDMAYGDKSEAMRHIFRARFRYLDSKYGASTSAPLEFRLWGNGKGVALRYYCPLYASLNWGAGGIITERAVTPGEPSFFPNPGTTFNETTFTVYNADLLTEISTYTEHPDGTRTEGGLQDLATRCSVSGLGGCRRLRSLELDYSGREANTNLDGRVLEACRSVAMRRMTVRNCPNVSGHADFASQVIESIDFRDTGVTGVSVPETDTLTALRLGAETAEIRLSNLGGLTDISVQGPDRLAVISFHNCPKADIRPILREALGGGALREVDITGVRWPGFTAGHLERLADLGASLTGEITLGDKEQMGFALKQKCLAVWGDIDSESNPLRVGYTKRPVEVVRISGAGYFGEPGDYQLTAVPDDPYANDFTRIEWSMSANGYAEIDTLTGRVRVNRTGTEELAPSAEVTVTVHRSDGTAVGRTTTVGFYERSARVGDWVYADGSYSDVYDSTKTVVGICCYIDPVDPRLRLATTLDTVATDAYGLDSVELKGITLADHEGISPYLISGIPVTRFWTVGCSAANIRDASTPDGFRAFGTPGWNRGGFVKLTSDTGPYRAGEIIPQGLADTLNAIGHRNMVLRDSGIGLEIPAAKDGKTEFTVLSECIAAAKAVISNASAASGYYFPAFSYAYAYQPSVKYGETLSDKFKAHRWFLPATGDAMRFCWMLDTKEAADAGMDSFAAAVNAGLMRSPQGMHTTGQISDYECLSYIKSCATFGETQGQRHRKSLSLGIRPFVQF